MMTKTKTNAVDLAVRQLAEAVAFFNEESRVHSCFQSAHENPIQQRCEEAYRDVRDAANAVVEQLRHLRNERHLRAWIHDLRERKLLRGNLNCLAQACEDMYGLAWIWRYYDEQLLPARDACFEERNTE